MYLSRDIVNEKKGEPGSRLAESVFSLPEKVLQFGTGVLLRGLPDYYIDKANKQGVFIGRIVVVKSTATSGADAFDKQQGLYTHCIRGVENGQVIDEVIVNTAISRVISAASDWNAVLECAMSRDMQVIISNTTEVGIVLVPDNIHADPPVSFPGKLLSFLYKRYRHFNGDPTTGMVIVPTELIPDNGKKLESIVLELAHQHGLESAFLDWLESANTFCNSLVDRIVPGKLSEAEYRKMSDKLGYEDELMIMSEVYSLWAIESSKPRVKEILSFHACDTGVVILPDINIHRELKLRLLNGSHTFTCGLAHLAGFKTVKEAMADSHFSSFITTLMKEEIVPAITGPDLTPSMAEQFAERVLDRYRNPFLDHYWLSITLQYTGKMAMRNIPILKSAIARTGSWPPAMTLGFAAYILFMKCQVDDSGKYIGLLNGGTYPITDEQASTFCDYWKESSIPDLVQKVLANTDWWGTDLSENTEAVGQITKQIQWLMRDGARQVLNQFKKEKITA